MNMDNDRDTVEFWSSLFQSFADSEPKDNPYPVVRSPIMTMSTPMAIDEPVEPWKVLEYGGKDVRPMAIDVPAEPWKVGGKEAQPANAAAEAGYKNVNTDQEKSTQKATEKGKEKEDAAKEGSKSLGKRPRGYEARIINDKRRRNDINSKIETLKEMTRCNGKRNLDSSLEYIINKIREMKLCVESYWRNSIGLMMPPGMGVVDIPAPWVYPYNYVPPHYMMYYNHFPVAPAPGETSGYANQFVPFTTYQGINNNNQPQTTKPM